MCLPPYELTLLCSCFFYIENILVVNSLWVCVFIYLYIRTYVCMYVYIFRASRQWLWPPRPSFSNRLCHRPMGLAILKLLPSFGNGTVCSPAPARSCRSLGPQTVCCVPRAALTILPVVILSAVYHPPACVHTYVCLFLSRRQEKNVPPWHTNVKHIHKANPLSMLVNSPLVYGFVFVLGFFFLH